ncbi:MAG: flippase-like domain-containing protein [Planctomycetes bacterium]|nr:flippase-like domain-containing protein [Planctomycetota bacterium]MCB9903980.1 flippase-like domain-containing protein [Planctomycetota bacterium]
MSDAQAGRGRFTSALKIALAIALLAWVASTLPWRDQLVFEEGSTALVARGEIEGVWREDAIAFRLDAEPALDADWPQAARDAQRSGTPFAVERDTKVEGGFDWRPGMPRVFSGIESKELGWALGMLVLGTLLGITRWWRLLQLASCPSSWWNTFRLTYLGMFFNLVIPGLTGGDVVKAIFVVQEHPERRPDALMTVVLDRMIGLWALIGLATGVIWTTGGELVQLRLPVGAVFLISTAGMTVVLSSRVRRLFRLDRLIAKLPFAEKIERLEESARVFQDRGMEVVFALVLSIGNHVAVTASAYFLGHGFGDALAFSDYVSIVSVGNVISSLPISPSGWGVGEFIYRELFVLAGSPGALGVAVSVSYRLCAMVLSLAGGLFLLTRGAPAVREAEAAIQEAV